MMKLIKMTFTLVLVYFHVISCSKKNSSTISSSTIPSTPPIVANVVLDSIRIENSVDTLIISKPHKFIVVGFYSNRTSKDLSDSISLTIDNTNATLLNKNIIGAKSGILTATITYSKFTLKKNLYIHNIEDAEIDPFLGSPASNASLIVPIVIINYLPTIDGISQDLNKAPDDYWVLKNSTLSESKKRILGQQKITKYGIEEGTRFRQYNSKQKIDPYVGIKVIKYFNVYETNLINWIKGFKTFDYDDLFKKLNMEHLVNNLGVKEIWITCFNKDAYPSVVNSQYNDPNTYYGLPESNMSSPTSSGDISNSIKIPNDLPVYSKTYVVYGNSGFRGAETNIHNRGHQIECQLNFIEGITMNSEVNNALFANLFVGVNPNLGNKPLNRVGMTHFPPNTSTDYDYSNLTLVDSDIKSWIPTGGKYEKINSLLWTSIIYDYNLVNQYTMGGINTVDDYSKDPQFKWLVFWFQSIPSKNNNIPYGNTTLSNWWELFYNWDDAIKNKKSLHN